MARYGWSMKTYYQYYQRTFGIGEAAIRPLKDNLSGIGTANAEPGTEIRRSSGRNDAPP